MNCFKNLPSEDVLLSWYQQHDHEDWYKVNAHIHTPYSFSSFDTIEAIFQQAVSENIKVLGINDFYVADGYDEFGRHASLNSIFPLFNIEFIGLMKEKQEQGIRINDPNNPGRIYFSGKGLDHPFHTGFLNSLRLRSVRKESQEQIRNMIDKVQKIIREIDNSIRFDYSYVRKNFAQQLVRERHIAKAIRVIAEEKFREPHARNEFYARLLGMEEYTDPGRPDVTENEIRARLLKAGGRAFVPEDERSFLPVKHVISTILQAGGIPCYPVLLDDPKGKFTEFEADKERLMQELLQLNVRCIELIPGRNNLSILSEFVKFFHGHGFIVIFGTEHNAPGYLPLEVMARNQEHLTEDLLKINYEGACIIAAHQYLRSRKKLGFAYPCGTLAIEKKQQFEELGRAVITYFIAQER